MYEIEKTASINDKDIVDLTSLISPNPIEINVPTAKKVKIVTTVWDADGGAYGDDDRIRDITDFYVPFESVSIGDAWQQAKITSNNPKMEFTVDYILIRCHQNFKGRGCNSWTWTR